MKKSVSIVILFFLAVVAQPLISESQNSISVLEFTTSGVSEAEMLIFVDYIASEIPGRSDYRLIDRRQREKILDEVKFSNTGCTDEECRLEIGKILSANLIIVGSIGSIGSTYILNMQLVDVETGETIRTTSNKYPDLDELVNDSRGLITALLDDESERPEPEPGTVTTVPEFTPVEPEKPSAIPTETVAAIPRKRITMRKTFIGTNYIYDGKIYESLTSRKLAENIIYPNIPHTPANINLFNEYSGENSVGRTLLWTGLGLTGAGVFLEVLGGTSGTDEVLYAGVAGLGIGLLTEIIGAVFLKNAHTKFGELVSVYNRNL